MSSVTMSRMFGLAFGLSAAIQTASPNASMFAGTRAVARRYSIVMTPSLLPPRNGGILKYYPSGCVPLSIEIPQTVKISPLSTKSVTRTPSSVVTVVEISDPTVVGETIEVIEQDAVQLESRPLRVRQVVVRLGTSVLLFQSTNLPIRTRTRLQTGFVAFVAFGPQAAGTLNGLPVGPDRILASTSGVEVEFVVAGGYESVSLAQSLIERLEIHYTPKQGSWLNLAAIA